MLYADPSMAQSVSAKVGPCCSRFQSLVACCRLQWPLSQHWAARGFACVWAPPRYPVSSAQPWSNIHAPRPRGCLAMPLHAALGHCPAAFLATLSLAVAVDPRCPPLPTLLLFPLCATGFCTRSPVPRPPLSPSRHHKPSFTRPCLLASSPPPSSPNTPQYAEYAARLVVLKQEMAQAIAADLRAAEAATKERNVDVATSSLRNAHQRAMALVRSSRHCFPPTRLLPISSYPPLPWSHTVADSLRARQPGCPGAGLSACGSSPPECSSGHQH